MSEPLVGPGLREGSSSTPPSPDAGALAELTRRWTAIAIAWTTTLVLFGAALAHVWSPRWAIRWTVVSAVLASYFLAMLRRRLGDNRRAVGLPLLACLGPGNALSIQRGLATVMVGGFLFQPRPPDSWAWLPVAFYTIASLADLFDGYLARRADHATLLGAWLDMELDSLGVLLVTLLAVSYGQLPIWYVPLALGRQLFLFGIGWRERRRLPIHPLPHSAHRRLFAGAQMGFISVALWPILPPEVVTLVGVVVAIPTAVGFVRDWLIVSGRIDPTGPTYRIVQQRVVEFARSALPLLLRPLVVIGPLASVREGAIAVGQPIAWVGCGLAMAVLVGFAGRLAALLFLVPVGIEILRDGLEFQRAVALVAAVGIILLGTGPLSIWRPEERYLFERPGTPGFGRR